MMADEETMAFAAPVREMTFTYIQGCRGIAALLVVLFHLAAAVAAEKYFGVPLFSQMLRFGSSGVEFFFVLSGFIIAFVHFDDLGQPSLLPRYLLRRAIRVYPAYWIIFIVTGLFAMMTPAFREGVPQDGVLLVKSLALVPQDPQVVGGTGAPLIVVAWSMQYEIVFYAMFALFIISQTAGAVGFTAYCGWWLLSTFWPAVPPFPLGFMEPHFFVNFGMGIIAAWLSRRQCVKAPLAWIVIGLTVYAALAAFENGEMLIGNLDRYPPRLPEVSLGYGFASALLVCGLVAAERSHQRPLPRTLMLLGEASYALYLLHYPIISAGCKILSRLGSNFVLATMAFAIILAACCLVSVAFHLAIERPLLRALGTRFSTRRRAVA
jgi:peptidoglycan/LPS O-acetylase OafA/YrhL